jgi:hypothetical protein
MFGGVLEWRPRPTPGCSAIEEEEEEESFQLHYGLGVDSASNRNEHHEYFLGVKAASA